MKLTGRSLQNLAGACVLAFSVGTFSTTAQAQGDAVLEEVVVVAQKREQNILDVPVSVTAVSGAQIEASGIKDMIELQQNVPGLIVTKSQTATTASFSIRGIGSTSNNFGVESSVGLYVDGVYRSRQSSMVNELIDVFAVEVLRGPQGTLFGKNTASGAINIRTAAPSSDATDGFIDVSLGDYNLQRFSAAANIPLTDNLAFRRTIFSIQRDGYVDDDVLGKDLFNDRDRFGVRAQVGYDNQSGFDMRVIADYSEVDEICCVALSRVDSIFSHGGLAQGLAIGGPDAIRMQLGHTVYTDFPYPMPLPPNVIQGVGFESYRTSVNKTPLSQNEDRGISVEMNVDIGDNTLTSITGYRAFDTLDFVDADFGDSRIAERTNIAEQQSISQELRLAGEFGDTGNWVFGAYYFTQDIDTDTTTVGGEDLQAYSDLGLAAQNSPTLSDITNGVTAFSQFVGSLGGFFPPGADAFPAGAFARDLTLQEHDGYAVFGQVDWALNDALTLTLGARYTDESKKINARYTQTNPGTMMPDFKAIGAILAGLAQGIPPADPTPLLAVALPNEGWAAWTLAPFSPRPDIDDKLDDDQVTGNAKISWHVNDEMMLYASYATGFKSGGTNTDRIWPDLNQLFTAETSKSAEIGFKGDIGDRLRVAASIYQTDFEDFQANSFTGTGFNLRNAGDLEVKGVEIEWLWQVFDNTSITGYYAHNEGEFKSFLEGTCWDATTFHTRNPQEPAKPSVDPGFDSATMTCDRSGEALPYNPEDRFNLGITQNFPIGANELFIRAEYSHTSEFLSDGDNDPLTRMDDFGILNVRVGLNIDSWNSTLTLWGRNVTDERYYTGSFDPPLLDNGRMNSYPSEPATYGITFRKHWD